MPPTMRLNNSFGVKESTRFRCLSLDIYICIYNRVNFSLSLFPFSFFLSFFDLETGFCLEPVTILPALSCLPSGPFQRDATFNLPDENFIRAIPRPWNAFGGR